jgi:hypothetical protein
MTGLIFQNGGSTHSIQIHISAFFTPKNKLKKTSKRAMGNLPAFKVRFFLIT